MLVYLLVVVLTGPLLSYNNQARRRPPTEYSVCLGEVINGSAIGRTCAVVIPRWAVVTSYISSDLLVTERAKIVGYSV